MVEGVRTGGIGAAAPVNRDGIRTAEGHFSVDDGGASPLRDAHLATTSTIGLDSMLSLQGVNEAEERDRRARKRGFSIIAALTKLQRALLAEEDPTSVLRSLEEISQENEAAVDPGLEAIVQALVLRSRVELARRAKSQRPGNAPD
jgi:Class II flagellar assembly regulator